MSSQQPQQQHHHDTLAQREQAAAQHPAPFDVIWDWIQIGLMCALATAVIAFAAGALVVWLKDYS